MELTSPKLTVSVVNVYAVSIAFEAPYFLYKHYVSIGVQWYSLPAPVLSGKATFELQHEVQNSKVSSSSARWLHTSVMAGAE